MPALRNSAFRSGDVLVLVGTMKGAFIFRGDGAPRAGRRAARTSPAAPSTRWPTTAAAAGSGCWAGTESMHWGAVLRTSDDFGRRWTNPEEANVKFPGGHRRSR